MSIIDHPLILGGKPFPRTFSSAIPRRSIFYSAHSRRRCHWSDQRLGPSRQRISRYGSIEGMGLLHRTATLNISNRWRALGIPAGCLRPTHRRSFSPEVETLVHVAYNIWAAIASNPSLAALAGVQMRASNFFSLPHRRTSSTASQNGRDRSGWSSWFPVGRQSRSISMALILDMALLTLTNIWHLSLIRIAAWNG